MSDQITTITVSDHILAEKAGLNIRAIESAILAGTVPNIANAFALHRGLEEMRRRCVNRCATAQPAHDGSLTPLSGGIDKN